MDMDTYHKLVGLISEARIPCRVTICNDGSIIVECGWEFPDSVFFKITKLGESIGIPVNTLEICAESYGHSIVESARIAGGPKPYYPNMKFVSTGRRIF